MRKITKNIR